jgi:hypothetical protein
MGQPMPRDLEGIIRRLRNCKPLTLGTATMAFCEPYMENDEHEIMFKQEARWWLRDTFSKRVYSTREAICKTWKDMPAVFAAIDASKVDKNPA